MKTKQSKKTSPVDTTTILAVAELTVRTPELPTMVVTKTIAIGFDDWTTVALVAGVSNPGKLYPINKRAKGEWECKCSAPKGIWCYHLKVATREGKKAVSGMKVPGLTILRPEAF